MKERYRLFLRRKSVYYAFDNTTKTFQSLKTHDRSEANRRDNELETVGWKLLRISTYQLREQMEDYCIPRILKNVKQLGGPDEGCPVSPAVQPDLPSLYLWGLGLGRPFLDP